MAKGSLVDDLDRIDISSAELVAIRTLEALDRQNALLDKLNVNLERLGESLPNLANSPVARLLGMKGK